MGLVSNLEFMRINANSLKFSYCLKLPYTKSFVGLLKFGFLACPTRIGGASYPWISQYGIKNNGFHVHTLFYILRFSQEEISEPSPYFQNRF